MTTPADWAPAILSAAAGADWGGRGAPGRMVLGAPSIDWSGCCDKLLGVELAPSGFQFTGDSWPQAGAVQMTPFGRDCSDDLWMATWHVSIVSCVPTFAPGTAGEAGRPPEPAALNAAAVSLLSDAQAVWHALRCAALHTWPSTLGRATVGGYTPLPVQSGCGGFQVSVVTRVKHCDRDC